MSEISKPYSPVKAKKIKSNKSMSRTPKKSLKKKVSELFLSQKSSSEEEKEDSFFDSSSSEAENSRLETNQQLA